VEEGLTVTKEERIAMIRASIPSEDQIKAACNRSLAAVSPTYLENWPSELRRLSIAQTGFELDARTLGAILSAMDESSGKPDPEALHELAAKIDSLLPQFPKGVFVRLGSRSPKDAYLSFDDDGFKVRSGAKAVVLLCDSMRVFDDLSLAQAADYTPWLFLREWKDIPDWTEFRCFMKDRKLIGISQYYHRSAYEELKGTTLIDWGIRMFFETCFKPASHLDDVVFDVFVNIKKDRTANQSIEVKLLEINPFGCMTDPCIFDWQKPEEFDGSLKVRKA
jgi:hypothetical protein